MALAANVVFVIFIQCILKWVLIWGVTMPYFGMNEEQDEYRLPELPYKFDELEPYIDRATVEVHYNGHHAAYTKKLNIALSQWRSDDSVDKEELASDSILEILGNIERVPKKYRTSVQNNGGGFVNHNIYWSVLSPNPTDDDREPGELLMKDITNRFGSYSQFVEDFTNEAMSIFGSGYVWLARQPEDKKLCILRTHNQDSLMSEGLHPIAVIDLWEHAYYLKHQNRRAKHISDWWKLLDWEKVSDLDEWWTSIAAHDEL